MRDLLKAAFATGDLRRLHLSWAASSVANWAFTVALAIYAYRVGGSSAVGLAALVRMLPAAVAAPFAGLLCDRHPRRTVLLVSALTRAAVLAVMSVVVVLAGPAVVVFALATLFTVLSSAQRPAQAALLPVLAKRPEQLAAANVVWSALDSAGFLVGALAAGLIVSATSVQLVLALTALGFVAAAAATARLSPDARPCERLPTPEGGVLRDTIAGFRTVAGAPGPRLVVGVLSSSFLVEGCVDVLIVVVAFELLGVGSAGVGWLSAGWGIGGVVGGGLALLLLGRGRLALGLGWGGLLLGGSLVISGALPYTPVVLAMLGVVGLGYALMEVSGQTLLQRLCSDEVLARAFGVVETSYWVMNALGAILAPALVAVVGVRWALVAAGAAPACLAVARWATLMRFEAGVPVPERELALLRGLPLFAPLPAATVETLARRLTRIPLESGNVVIEQGDPGDRFYVIADGRFDVDESGATRPSMGAGDFFGEIALLRDVPRTATVTAGTDGLLYSLDRDDFLTAVLGHHRSRQVGERTVASRLGELEAAPPRTARSR